MSDKNEKDEKEAPREKPRRPDPKLENVQLRTGVGARRWPQPSADEETEGD